MIAGEQYLFVFVVEADMSRRVSRRQQAFKIVVADLNNAAVVN
jgi:hypothetical protein